MAKMDNDPYELAFSMQTSSSSNFSEMNKHKMEEKMSKQNIQVCKTIAQMMVDRNCERVEMYAVFNVNDDTVNESSSSAVMFQSVSLLQQLQVPFSVVGCAWRGERIQKTSRSDQPSETICVLYPFSGIVLDEYETWSSRFLHETSIRELYMLTLVHHSHIRPNSMLRWKPWESTSNHPAIRPSVHVQWCMESSLTYNVTRHEKVPPHRLLSLEEKQRNLATFRSAETQFPEIFITDPVAMYLGMVGGDMVEIKRKNPMTGFTFYFRMGKVPDITSRKIKRT